MLHTTNLISYDQMIKKLKSPDGTLVLPFYRDKHYQGSSSGVKFGFMLFSLEQELLIPMPSLPLGEVVLGGVPSQIIDTDPGEKNICLERFTLGERYLIDGKTAESTITLYGQPLDKKTIVPPKACDTKVNTYLKSPLEGVRDVNLRYPFKRMLRSDIRRVRIYFVEAESFTSKCLFTMTATSWLKEYLKINYNS